MELRPLTAREISEDLAEVEARINELQTVEELRQHRAKLSSIRFENQYAKAMLEFAKAHCECRLIELEWSDYDE